MRRTKSFDEMLSKRLQNVDYAREYIIASMEGDEPQTLVESLIEVMDIIGHKEFAKMVDMQQPAITRIVSTGDIPKFSTLNKLLAPFKLKARLDVEEVA